MKAIKQTFFTINNMEGHVNEIDELIIIENLDQLSLKKVEIQGSTNDDDAGSISNFDGALCA